jgi:hypothetical protein
MTASRPLYAGLVGEALLVRFLDDVHPLATGQQLTFGRAADVVLDEANLYLHRVVGRFVWWDGFWWVENLGEALELQLHGGDGSHVRLPPATQAPLTQPQAVVRFSAGGLPYEIEVTLPASPSTSPPAVAPTAGLATTRYGEVTLTEDEKALVVELARPFLLDPGAGPERLPSNEDVAAALGWGRTKLNRKLDYLCERLTRAGVRGLQGGRGQLATNRRWVLVQHALVARLVIPDDLVR